MKILVGGRGAAEIFLCVLGGFKKSVKSRVGCRM